MIRRATNSASQPRASPARQTYAPDTLRSVLSDDPREIVRRGYDAVSIRYDEHYGGEHKYQAWLTELRGLVPPGGAVLDLGCGSGMPVARDLAGAGYRVTGVDISEVQIRRARELVPNAAFVCADFASVEGAARTTRLRFSKTDSCR